MTEKKHKAVRADIGPDGPGPWVGDDGYNKYSGRKIHPAPISGGVVGLFEAASEDGVLEFSHGDAIAVMDLGEEFEPSRKSARLLLQLIDDGRHLPTINERLKAVPVDAHTLLNLVWMLRNEGRKLNAKKGGWLQECHGP